MSLFLSLKRYFFWSQSSLSWTCIRWYWKCFLKWRTSTAYWARNREMQRLKVNSAGANWLIHDIKCTFSWNRISKTPSMESWSLFYLVRRGFKPQNPQRKTSGGKSPRLWFGLESSSVPKPGLVRLGLQCSTGPSAGWWRRTGRARGTPAPFSNSASGYQSHFFVLLSLFKLFASPPPPFLKERVFSDGCKKSEFPRRRPHTLVALPRSFKWNMIWRGKCMEPESKVSVEAARAKLLSSWCACVRYIKATQYLGWIRVLPKRYDVIIHNVAFTLLWHPSLFKDDKLFKSTFLSMLTRTSAMTQIMECTASWKK